MGTKNLIMMMKKSHHRIPSDSPNGLMMMRTMEIMVMMRKPHHKIPSLGSNGEDDNEENGEYDEEEKILP